MVSISVVHPLDTIRTRIQTARSGSFQGVIPVIKGIYQAEGWKAFYQGLSASLATGGLSKAVMFFSFGFASRFLQEEFKLSPSTLTSAFGSGAFGGLFQSVVMCPIELVRNRLQVQRRHMNTAAATSAASEYVYPPLSWNRALSL